MAAPTRQKTTRLLVLTHHAFFWLRICHLLASLGTFHHLELSRKVSELPSPLLHLHGVGRVSCLVHLSQSLGLWSCFTLMGLTVLADGLGQMCGTSVGQGSALQGFAK